jgi:hypothetical protein
VRMNVVVKSAPLAVSAKQSEKTEKLIDLVDTDMTPAKPTGAAHTEASEREHWEAAGRQGYFFAPKCLGSSWCGHGALLAYSASSEEAAVARDDDEEWTAKSKKVSDDEDDEYDEEDEDEEFATATKKRGRATKSGGEKESKSRAAPGKK